MEDENSDENKYLLMEELKAVELKLQATLDYNDQVLLFLKDLSFNI